MNSIRNHTSQISIAAGIALLVACGAPQNPAAAPTTPAPAVAASTTPLSPTTPVSNNTSDAATAAPATPSTTMATPAANSPPLTVAIEPRSGSHLKGTAKFEASSEGVKVTLDVSGATPGEHGTHIHQTADCSDKDGKSAGDHFNPGMHEHGLPPEATRHLGDLGNIAIDKSGKGHLEITVANANLTRGDKMSFLDRGIIIHEKVDNGGQPTGNAGKRIGCGEIK